MVWLKLGITRTKSKTHTGVAYAEFPEYGKWTDKLFFKSLSNLSVLIISE